jgi:hypothetical protein
MLSDLRDVLFLADPFDFEIGNGVSCFLEDERFSLGDQVNNRGWLTGGYGDEVFDELRDRPISCSGITIGAAGAVRTYLETMVGELMLLKRQFRGMDQGVHNYILHKGLVPQARLLGNVDGPVLTVGLMDPDSALALFRRRRPEVKVVHQYDRQPQLAAALTESGEPPPTA